MRSGGIVSYKNANDKTNQMVMTSNMDQYLKQINSLVGVHFIRVDDLCMT